LNDDLVPVIMPPACYQETLYSSEYNAILVQLSSVCDVSDAGTSQSL